jgi:hypothetical protein
MGPIVLDESETDPFSGFYERGRPIWHKGSSRAEFPFRILLNYYEKWPDSDPLPDKTKPFHYCPASIYSVLRDPMAFALRYYLRRSSHDIEEITGCANSFIQSIAEFYPVDISTHPLGDEIDKGNYCTSFSIL